MAGSSLLNESIGIRPILLFRTAPATDRPDREGCYDLNVFGTLPREMRLESNMTKVRVGGWVSLCFVLCFSSSQWAWSQVTAAISGRVEDSSGAAVGGATVTVRSLETGATRTVTTDETGTYRILSLPLGAQEVRAERPGFQTALRTGVNLVDSCT